MRYMPKTHFESGSTCSHLWRELMPHVSMIGLAPLYIFHLWNDLYRKSQYLPGHRSVLTGLNFDPSRTPPPISYSTYFGLWTLLFSPLLNWKISFSWAHLAHKKYIIRFIIVIFVLQMMYWYILRHSHCLIS